MGPNAIAAEEPEPPMHPIRIAAQLHPQHGAWADLRAGALRAEALGYDIVYTWDHFFPLGGDPRGRHFECWSLLAALAEATERVEIGPLVSCNSYRNPNLLADIVRTVDHISNGRAILGVGAGWFRTDYEEYGYELGTPASRLRDLDRNMPIIIDRLGKLNPGPVRNPFPIMIGGSGEKVTLRIVAQHATIWNGQGEPADLARKNKILDEWCERVGRDPRGIERSAQLFPPQLPKVDEYLAAGITHIICDAKGPDYDLTPLHRLIEWRDGHMARLAATL